MPKKILVIDDEADIAKTIKMRLEVNGYSVELASNGVEGEEKMNELMPDLILLDIMMPDKDGFTFLRDMKKNDETKNIPVIVLTAKPDMRELFEPEGINDYLIKPFDPEELMDKIKKALGG